jgi:7-cyano-7-deazaguanine synthase
VQCSSEPVPGDAVIAWFRMGHAFSSWCHMPKAPAVVLSSGGLRSLVCAAIGTREHRIALLFINDHRLPAKQAHEAFERQVAFFKPLKYMTIDAPFVRQISLPPETAGLATSTSSDAQSGLIPFREMHMLSLACSFARQMHAGTILWGVQHEPKASDALAKNIELVQVFNQLLEVYGGDPVVTLRTPLMGLEDQQVIELAYQMGAPLNASWSCQMNLDHPCMNCLACARRTRAFRAAQLADPLVVAK